MSTTKIPDQVFRLSDGWFCFVSGKVFGPWELKGYAEAGMATEHRRVARRIADEEAREEALAHGQFGVGA